MVENEDEIAEEKEIHIHSLMKSVEKFVINVYASCPRVEAMWLILSSDLGQRAFNTFVKAERAEEYFTLFKEITEIRMIIKPSKNVLSQSLIKINKTYLENDAVMCIPLSYNLRLEIANVEGLNLEEPLNFIGYFLDILERLQNETVFIMARDQFNRFILSKYYKQWRASESSHAVATTKHDMSEEIIKRAVSGHFPASATESSKVVEKMKRIISPVNMTTKAFANMDNNELKYIIGRTDNWLAALISAVEALPICFSLAVATPTQSFNVSANKKPSFPLIYVNKYFEKITGYNRSDVIGKATKDLLQCPESEPEPIQQMAESLKSMEQCIVIITNRDATGRLFRNLVVLIPIRDDHDKYRYVVSFTFDVSKEVDECVSKLKLADDLSQMIPDMIYADEESPTRKRFLFF